MTESNYVPPTIDEAGAEAAIPVIAVPQPAPAEQQTQPAKAPRAARPPIIVTAILVFFLFSAGFPLPLVGFTALALGFRWYRYYKSK